MTTQFSPEEVSQAIQHLSPSAALELEVLLLRNRVAVLEANPMQVIEGVGEEDADDSIS